MINLEQPIILRMRFQARDGAILQAIYDYDGVLARRHIQRMFWPGKSKRAMDRRLSLLKQKGFLRWPDRIQHRTKPIPEPIVWLDWRGALFIANMSGINTETPEKANEAQLRRLQSRLRVLGIHWLREPRWSLLSHDLHVIDFRLAVNQSVRDESGLEVLEWINESVFRGKPDIIEFTIRNRSGYSIQRKKGVCPDGFFYLIDEKRKLASLPHKARFLLEVDMATHANPRFGIEKAAAGAAYIQSNAYMQRFGANAGRWLIVTTSKVRMKNLMQQTVQKVEKHTQLFFFTTFDQINTCNILTDPIWWLVNNSEPTSLITG